MIVLNDFSHDSRVLREASALAGAHYQVFLLALAGENLKQKEMVNGFQVIRIALDTSRLLAKTNIRGLRFLEFMVKALMLIGRLKPLVCHCHDLNTLPIGYLAKKIWRTGLIYDTHELESQKAGIKQEPKWWRWSTRRLEHFLIRRTDRVITIGHGIAQYLTKQDNIPLPLVIRNIPEIANKDLANHQKHFGFNQNYKVVIYQGGLQIWRGLFNLIRSLKFLDKNIVLVLIGDGPIRQELEQEAKKLHLAHRVFFKGWLAPEKLLAMTSQADLGILCSENVCQSYYLTLPSKFFEYISAGLPVATSHFPEVSQIIKQYQLGQTFDPARPQDMARAIQSIFKNKAQYQTLKRNVIRAQKTFNWQREKLKLINLYHKLQDSAVIARKDPLTCAQVRGG